MKTCKLQLARLSRAAKIGALLGAIICAVPAVQAQNMNGNDNPSAAKANASISRRGKEFLKDAALANQTEIAMGDVAENRSQNTKVKDFAQMMRTDHQKNFELVQGLAQAHNVAVDASPDWMARREIDRLKKVDAAEFDKDYTKLMLKDHVKVIKRFDKAAGDIEEQDIRTYAQNTLPTLREHLAHSEEAARAAGVDESTISSIVKDLPSENRSVTTR